MKVWNVGEIEINQQYNGRNIYIKANQVVDVNDDAAVFLLNKKEIVGKGLVQLKDGDDKAGRYRQGRKQIYDWALGKHDDYMKHCEERQEINRPVFRPHQAILEFKKLIEEYEKWQADGEPVKEEYHEKVGEVKVYLCPICEMEFKDKLVYLSHIPSHNEHQEVGNAINTGPVADKGKGKSR